MWERVKTVAIWYFLGSIVMLLWRFHLTGNWHAIMDAVVCAFIGLWVVHDKIVRKQRWDDFFVFGSMLMVGFVIWAWHLW